MNHATNSTMGKNKSKSKKYNPLKALIVKKLAAKYEVDPAFVRMAINGDRDSDKAQVIKKEYTDCYKTLKDLTESI